MKGLYNYHNYEEVPRLFRDMNALIQNVKRSTNDELCYECKYSLFHATGFMIGLCSIGGFMTSRYKVCDLYEPI